MNLTSIKHPTGAFSIYQYGQVLKNIGPYGLQDCYRIISRKDMIDTAVYNEKTYTYSIDNNTGYPAYYDPTTLPNTFTYSTTITTPTTGLTETHKFNNKHLTTSVESKTGNKRVEDTLFENYHADILPGKVTRKTYDDTNNAIFTQSVELMQYDNKGNVTAFWSPLAVGSTANAEYKTTYTYDSSYSQLTGVSYKQNATTTITKTYTLGGANHHPIREVVMVGGSTMPKSKTEWDYDSYGTSLQKDVTRII